MNPVGKVLLWGGCLALLGVSVWGWLQVPSLLNRGVLAEFEPHYRACLDNPIGPNTKTSCSWVLTQARPDPELRAKALIRRGVFYNMTARYRDAIRDFDAVIAAPDTGDDPIVLAALSDRSYAREMLGDNRGAWADADSIVARAPANSSGYDARAFLHLRVKQYALAAKDYDGLIRNDPDEAYGYNNRCWYRAIANQLAGALVDCNRALDLAPQYAPALDSRGFVYFKLGRYAEARDDYDAAILAGSYRASTFYVRGLTKIRLGGTSGGMADVETAKRLDPKIAETFADYGATP